MSDSDLAASSFISESEAFETLEQLAGRRTLPIPADTLVRHTLALPGPWDWPVRRRRSRLCCAGWSRRAARNCR